MKNLYEILGALPDDDADSLRAAFRKAAKANHPDNNPGDPDAPLRFRQVVRANAILSDQRQRATYDRLLAVALREQGVKSTRGIFSDRARKLASNAILSAVISVVSIGGYLLFGDVPRAHLVPARVIEASQREPALAAAVISKQLSDAIGPAGPRRPDNIGAPNEPKNPEADKEAAAANAAAPAQNTGGAPAVTNVPATPGFGVRDARSYLEQGILAYRSGDLNLALVDFDLAIDRDPLFLDAYVNRGIVFHRMGDLKRAFADIAQAKRIDELNQNRTLLLRQQRTSPRKG